MVVLGRLVGLLSKQWKHGVWYWCRLNPFLEGFGVGTIKDIHIRSTLSFNLTTSQPIYQDNQDEGGAVFGRI